MNRLHERSSSSLRRLTRLLDPAEQPPAAVYSWEIRVNGRAAPDAAPVGITVHGQAEIREDGPTVLDILELLAERAAEEALPEIAYPESIQVTIVPAEVRG